MLYSKDFSSVSQVFSYIDKVYLRGDGPALHFFVMLPNDNITPKKLQEIAIRNGSLCEFKKKGEDLYSFEVGPGKIGDMGYLIQKTKYWIFITDFIGEKLGAFIKKFSPLIGLAYVDSEMLLDIVKESQKAFKMIKVIEGTFCSLNESFRNWKKKPIEFSKADLIQRSQKQNFRWTALALLIKIGEENLLRLRISDKGEITLYRGSFEKFYNYFVLGFIKKSMILKGFMSNRERRVDRGQIVVRPISIGFKKELSMSNIKIIKESLMKKYLSAIIHTGNPILMMQITDKKDGSSFDVFASRRKLKIIPLLKSSAISLTELFNNISNTLPSLRLIR